MATKRTQPTKRSAAGKPVKVSKPAKASKAPKAIKVPKASMRTSGSARTSVSSKRVTSTRVGDIGKRSASASAPAASADAPLSGASSAFSRKTTKRRVSSAAAARVSGAAKGKTGAAKAASNYRKYLALIVAAVALVAVFIGGYIALYNSNVFEIEEVSVKGVDHLTATDLQNLAGVEQGTTLLNVDADSIIEALKVDAWVQDVKVNRVFPHTLELEVTERTIKAVVKVPSSDGSSTVDWAIASDGMWLMPIPAQDSDEGKLVNPQVYEDAANVLVISDVPYTTKPEIGTYCSDENVNNALSIVAGLTTELADRVTAVKATETQSTTLTIKDGPDIVFGTAEDIREKERVCLEIMSAHPDGVSYINVRNVSRPTYRAL